MRNLFAFDMVSLDGCFEGASPWSIDWHHVDEEFNEYSLRQLEGVDTLLFGRVTFQGMAGWWQSDNAMANAPVVARKMNETPKVVFSSTLEKAEWTNSRLVKEDIAGEVARLKNQPGREIAIFGSGKLTVSLLRLGLVDEVRLIVNPIVLAGGRPLFAGLNDNLRLQLLRTHVFKSGNVLLCYKPLNA